MKLRRLAMGFAAVAGGCAAFAACERGGAPGPAPAGRPNIVWIVWDTVRADHLPLYGYARPTSPFLGAWAQDARVFDDALSVAGYTLPSHASLFTGLLPSEHCTHNQHPWLDDSFTTVAELLRDAGYRTYLFSANPHVAGAAGGNLAQGFETIEHPWSPQWIAEALRLVEAKTPPEDRSSELRERLASMRSGGGSGGAIPWNLKAAGALARTATLAWLKAGDPARPFFVFINQMEAHRPTIPPRRLREKLLSPEDVERSYRVDRSWLPMWEYTFGLREYSEQDLALTRATYDASLLELDELFRDLIAALREIGALDDTVVILTSDHGEHLGDAHMLDHQYSLHQALLRVPLVVWAPQRLAPGREAAPVATFDLFPTVLELAGVPAPAGLRSQAVSLLSPRRERLRLAEDPASSDIGIAQVKQRHPDFDPSPFQRRLRALVSGSHKFVWGSDGRHALYDLARDPLEARNRLADEPAIAARLDGELAGLWDSLARCQPKPLPPADRAGAPEQREMLEALGYLEEDADAPSGR